MGKQEGGFGKGGGGVVSQMCIGVFSLCNNLG